MPEWESAQLEKRLHKRGEAAAKESEDKYRMLVENSLQGLAIIQDGCFVFCNSALAEMSGYSVEELLSFPHSSTLIHPDDRSAVQKRHLERLAGVSLAQHHEHRILRKDGTVCWVELCASLIDFNGKPAVQVASMDVTARKEAEEALKDSKEYLNQIINRIGDPIFVKDRDHRFVLVNDAFCSFLGTPREVLIGTSDVPGEISLPLWQKEEEVLRTGKECLTEDNLLDGQGNYRIVLTRKSRLTDKNGNHQIVGVLRDISEYKRLEVQFLQSQKMEAIGVLAGGVAHDFNNLLNVINGYSELVLEDLDRANPIRGDIEQIRNAGKRAATLTSQLLAFGRKQILQPKILDLNQSITSIGSMLRRMIGEDIELISKTQPGLGMVNADPGKIEQIIMNMAVNARDAMPRGGMLTIETANVQLDENYLVDHPFVKTGPFVMLAISDSGIGMNVETQSRIFEPFFTTKEKGKGTGLGLSTVYGIVKQSNGFIWVYSEPGKGTTFKIYFPRVEGEKTRLPEDLVESVLCGSETVLLVEDENAVRALAGRILRERGYKVMEASHGEDALRIAHEYDGEIHLVLTDAVMPGMSGNALVTHIEAERPGIKSLYISGYTDSAIVHHGILNSSIAFLQKPFTVEGLTRKIREVLNASPARAEQPDTLSL
jgi:two-component system, cell cycle sensor histidine kinase and response regulator CckA